MLTLQFYRNGILLQTITNIDSDGIDYNSIYALSAFGPTEQNDIITLTYS